MIFVSWIILSFLVAMAGSGRKIGFFGALILSLIFSPVVGIIGVALSAREEEKKSTFNEAEYHRKRAMHNDAEEQRQYERLKWMKDKGILTEDEFIKKRNELFDTYR